MSFADQIKSDLDVFFDTGYLAESGTLNDESVDVVVVDEGEAEENGVKYDFLDVCFRADDYAVIAYRTDSLVMRSATWRYPELKDDDTLTKTVRFRKKERLAGWK